MQEAVSPTPAHAPRWHEAVQPAGAEPRRCSPSKERVEGLGNECALSAIDLRNDAARMIREL